MSDSEIKVERSMPVQARVDLTTLAMLSNYWDGSGHYVNTMSRLIAWSLEAFLEVLKNNGLVSSEVDSLDNAFNILARKGLIQKSLEKRMERKLLSAKGLESARIDGHTSFRNTQMFKQMHKSGTVESAPKMYNRPMSKEIAKGVKIFNELEKKELLEGVEKQKNDAIGVITTNDNDLQPPKTNQDQSQSQINSVNSDNLESSDIVSTSGSRSERDKVSVDLGRNLEKMREADERLERF